MSTEKKNIDFDQMMKFVREFGLRIVMRGVLTFVAVIAILALYYAFAPRKESWRQKLSVTLESRGTESVYANGRKFSSTDLISSPVMNRVWKEHGLADKVKIESFCKWFSLVNYDPNRAAIDAEFQSKMSKRNIYVTEIRALQRDYEAKLAANEASGQYVLAMTPTVALSKEESVSIISDVPKAWFEEYSILNAPKMPAMMRSDVVAAYAKRIQEGNGRSLELVDALRMYIKEIGATCTYIRDSLLKGRNVIVDGVDLGTYEARLELVRAELLRLKNSLLVYGDPTDLESFVAARIDDMACETLAVEEKANAVKKAFELLAETAGIRGTGSARKDMSTDGAVTLQADATFFNDFTAMVRRDAHQEAVQKYADELASYNKELADIKARKLYYDQIGDYAKKTRSRNDAKKGEEKLVSQVVAYAQELSDIGNKVMAFRDRSLHVYRTPDMFYALPNPVSYAKRFVFSLPRFALGLLALWLLYNLSCLGRAWMNWSKRD